MLERSLHYIIIHFLLFLTITGLACNAFSLTLTCTITQINLEIAISKINADLFESRTGPAQLSL